MNEAHRSLGPKRQSHLEQREFLVDIAAKFQDIAALATRADYGRDDFFSNSDSLRLATATVNRGKAFTEEMALHGHVINFEIGSEIPSIEEVAFESLALSGTKTFTTRQVADHPDIEDLVSECAELSCPYDHAVLGWLKSVYRRSRGFELGTFDSSLLATTMKTQAKKWRGITQGYVSDMIALVHNFVIELLQHILPGNRHVRDNLAAVLFDHLRRRYEVALEHADFLLSVELEGTPATYNHYFQDTLDKRYFKSRCDIIHLTYN